MSSLRGSVPTFEATPEHSPENENHTKRILKPVSPNFSPKSMKDITPKVSYVSKINSAQKNSPNITPNFTSNSRINSAQKASPNATPNNGRASKINFTQIDSLNTTPNIARISEVNSNKKIQLLTLHISQK